MTKIKYELPENAPECPATWSMHDKIVRYAHWSLTDEKELYAVGIASSKKEAPTPVLFNERFIDPDKPKEHVLMVFPNYESVAAALASLILNEKLTKDSARIIKGTVADFFDLHALLASKYAKTYPNIRLDVGVFDMYGECVASDCLKSKFSQIH